MAKAKKKPVVKRAVEPKLYAMNSSTDDDLYRPMPMSDIRERLDSWEFDDDEIINVYELKLVKKYKAGQRYVEVK